MSFRRQRVLGNRSLEAFDVLVIGSGAGGGATAEALTRAGQKVLILEAGPNYFLGLDDPDPAALGNVFSNDELKFRRRHFIEPDPLVDPRSFRESEAEGERSFVGDVNHLPKIVGGGAVHSNITTIRFAPTDFELGSRLAGRYPGASFADWPVGYEELEPLFVHNEHMLGVQGEPEQNPFEPPRSAKLPMPPGPDAAAGYRIGEAARALGYHPFLAPHAITSRPYEGRPPCAGCGFCGGYGCPVNAKGSPAVTSVRRALLSGNALLLSETRVVRLRLSGSGREVAAVEAIGPDGGRERYRADRYVLAAGAIEDARLLMLSGDGDPIGNSSGLVGRNLTFHALHSVAGVFRERIHSHRGKTVSTGLADLRGSPDDPKRPLGGLVLAGGAMLPIEEALIYGGMLGARGGRLAALLRQSPMRDRMLGASMYAEDAPQLENRVDLDPKLRDLDGLPAPRITYRQHAFELEARALYLPKLVELVRKAGAFAVFTSPVRSALDSRHIFGTLRFGRDPRHSVCGRDGRFHDIGNLHATGSSLFPTSSGYNPILTISTLGTWVGTAMA